MSNANATFTGSLILPENEMDLAFSGIELIYQTSSPANGTTPDGQRCKALAGPFSKLKDINR
jgi:hypothetical protein